VEHVAFPDGEQFTMWLDRDRTAAEVWRASPRKTRAAYIRLLDEYDQVKDDLQAGLSSPRSGSARPSTRCWPSTRRGGSGPRRRQLSALEVVRHEFTSRQRPGPILLWMAFQVFQPVDTPGSGVLPYAQGLRPPAAQLVHPDRRVGGP